MMRIRVGVKGDIFGGLDGDSWERGEVKEWIRFPQNWIERDKFCRSGQVKLYKGCILGNVSSDYY
jgi:hypothetical protein